MLRSLAKGDKFPTKRRLLTSTLDIRVSCRMPPKYAAQVVIYIIRLRYHTARIGSLEIFAEPIELYYLFSIQHVLAVFSS